MSESHVWIRAKHDLEQGAIYICGDEDGEFARAGTVEAILKYAADLIYGPGTEKSGPLYDRCAYGARER